MMKAIISPIQTQPGKRYFTDQTGNPVFWLGDTQWELFRMFNASQATGILKDRQAKGFNIILIMLLGVETWRVIPGAQISYANLDGESPWIGGDPLRPNEIYFRHVDELIRLGERFDQAFVIGIYHQWHKEIITLEKARPWARWVARRYRDVPNLIWSMYPQATDAFIPVCRELAAGLQEGDHGTHLISMHPDPSVASSSFMHDETWLAYNMIQTWNTYDQIHPAVTADYLRFPIKPVVLAEGGYEGVASNQLQKAHAIRKQAYWTQLAGGHYVYGHNDAWVAPQRWGEWIDAPGSIQLKVFKEIITSLDSWWDLVPDQSLFVSGEGSGFKLNTAARSADGRWMLIYLSEPGTVSIRLDEFPSSRQVKASWIDPTNGNHHWIDRFNHMGSILFALPTGWEDGLLLVEALD